MHNPPAAHRRAAALLCLAAVALAACGNAGAAGTSSGSTTGGPNGSHPTSTSTSSSTTTTTTNPLQAPMTQPTAANPLTILEIGDSLGVDLGWGMTYSAFANDPLVKVIQGAKGDTGLSRPDYYDWPAALENYLQQDHPGAVVVFLGGNDGQGFMWQGRAVAYATPLWRTIYANRVAEIIKECLAAGARVLWVGMPVMQDPSLNSVMQNLDSIYQSVSAKHPGATYFSSWPVFSTPSGQYTSTVEVDGQAEVVRDSDGTHLDTDGENLLAASIVPAMEKAWGIQLLPSSSGSTTTTASG